MKTSNDKPDKKTNRLWAPWRIEYIETVSKHEGCIFCDKSAEKDDRKNLIVCRGTHVFVMMNRYPYNNGHLMVVTCRHIGDLCDLNSEEKIELFDMLQCMKKILSAVLNPQGFNIGLNLGRIAGAGIEDHIHFHVVPRWQGDTNFMPVSGHTKVISEALEQTWEKLAKASVEHFNNKKEKQ